MSVIQYSAGGVIHGFTLMGDPKGGGEEPSRPSGLQRQSSERQKDAAFGLKMMSRG